MKDRFSGSKLQTERIKAGLSVAALADLSGVNPKTISNMEADSAYRHRLAVEMLLAQALGVPLRRLYAENRAK